MLFPTYFSGGIKVTFVGEDLDVVPTVLVIDVVDIATNRSALPMPYNIVSSYVATHNIILCSVKDRFSAKICFITGTDVWTC